MKRGRLWFDEVVLYVNDLNEGDIAISNLFYIATLSAQLNLKRVLMDYW